MVANTPEQGEGLSPNTAELMRVKFAITPSNEFAPVPAVVCLRQEQEQHQVQQLRGPTQPQPIAVAHVGADVSQVQQGGAVAAAVVADVSAGLTAGVAGVTAVLNDPGFAYSLGDTEEEDAGEAVQRKPLIYTVSFMHVCITAYTGIHMTTTVLCMVLAADVCTSHRCSFFFAFVGLWSDMGLESSMCPFLLQQVPTPTRLAPLPPTPKAPHSHSINMLCSTHSSHIPYTTHSTCSRHPNSKHPCPSTYCPYQPITVIKECPRQWTHANNGSKQAERYGKGRASMPTMCRGRGRGRGRGRPHSLTSISTSSSTEGINGSRGMFP